MPLPFKRLAAVALMGMAVLCAAAAIFWGATRAAFVVGGIGVGAAICAGLLWISAVVRTAAENAEHKDTIESRRHRGDPEPD